jgi:acetate kinase
MATLVQVINSGSSSIKYQLIDLADPGRPIIWASGLVERIGEGDSLLTHHTRIGRGADSELATTEIRSSLADHAAGFEAISEVFAATGPVDEVGSLAAFGHRVVHGGDAFSAPALVDEEVLAAITACIPLAPLHNPANLAGIRGAIAAHPGLPNVAVFDTAFHQTMPMSSYLYAIDAQLAAEHRIRRYGFHGTSHAYVARRAVETLGLAPDTARLITLHLGNGASAAAILGGRSMDTSMGMTPLEGLVMGTRSGDIDPAIVGHLVREAGLSVADVEAMLNKNSGLKGLCGENDLRPIHRRAAAGDSAAAAALDVYVHRLRSYVGSYLVELGGADAIVFTAGVGQHDAAIRAATCAGMQWLGIQLDATANAQADGTAIAVVSSSQSQIAVIVVPTDEELEIAQQTLSVLAG